MREYAQRIGVWKERAFPWAQLLFDVGQGTSSRRLVNLLLIVNQDTWPPSKQMALPTHISRLYAPI